MKKYDIKVNGTVYSVEVEEVGSVEAPKAQPAPTQPKPASTSTPKATAAPKKTEKKASPAAAVPSEGATSVEAPMPGTILDIKVSQGQSVSAGEVLILLEAMKMENEIVAPQAGTIDAILIEKGASVNAGDAIISII